MEKKYKINTEIYPKDIIKQAIIEFKDISEINFNKTLLTINWENEIEIEEVFNEFMNYIIWLINE